MLDFESAEDLAEASKELCQRYSERRLIERLHVRSPRRAYEVLVGLRRPHDASSKKLAKNSGEVDYTRWQFPVGGAGSVGSRTETGVAVSPLQGIVYARSFIQAADCLTLLVSLPAKPQQCSLAGDAGATPCHTAEERDCRVSKIRSYSLAARMPAE